MPGEDCGVGRGIGGIRGAAGARTGGVDEGGIAPLSDFILFAHHDWLLMGNHRANLYSMTPRSSNCVTVASEDVYVAALMIVSMSLISDSE